MHLESNNVAAGSNPARGFMDIEALVMSILLTLAAFGFGLAAMIAMVI